MENKEIKFPLRVEDNICVRTIDEACALFGTKANRYGYKRFSGAKIPNKDNEIVWCPNAKNDTWDNTISDDGMEICEFHKKSEEERINHVEKYLSTPQRRVTFFKSKSVYRFVGVFELDNEKTKQENECVWKRISDSYEL